MSGTVTSTGASADPATALLRLARAALATDRLAPPVAVRSALVLARQSVEAAVRARLRRDLPGAEAGSARAQLLCVRALDPRLGTEAAHLHGELSRGCHHLPYELGPTRDEATALLERTEAVVARASGPAPRRTTRDRRRGHVPPPPSEGEQVALPFGER